MADLGPEGDAARAQRVYREIVGDMAWFATVPGALDRLCLDADVIDDDSVRRAAVTGGRLTVSTEAYRALVLPAVTVLDEDVAARLDEFAAGGGLLIAVGALPDSPRLRARFETGEAAYVESSERLGEALAGLVRRVEAPVPPLVREVGDTTLVFLTATFPMASRIGVGRPEERGVELGWLDAAIDFDPGRYAREMRVKVRGVSGTPLLAGLFGGEPRALPYTLDGDAVEVVVPFDDGPAALLVFDGTHTDVAPPPAPYPGHASEEALAAPYLQEIDLGEEWAVELVPTLDDTWSDFGSSATVEHWTLRTPDGEAVHATFGPRGEQRVTGAEHRDRARTPDGPWTPSVWSASRGLRKDPVHRDTLGPKGHVPGEFLAFGRVEAGGHARFRTVLTVPAGRQAWLAVGAGAAKTVWLDGDEQPLDDAGYAAVSLSPLAPGDHALELLLVPDEELDLRAYVCLVGDPADAARPEWIGGSPLETTVRAGAPELIQVASTAPCVVYVNGEEAGRQGGFDPYEEADIPRVRRYDVAHLLRPGDNTIRVESDGWVLVDGLVVSGPGWSSRPRVRRRQHGDPAALYLRPRPHPLPEAGWLDGRPAALPAGFAVPGSRSGVECFLLDPPPGVTDIQVDAAGPVEIVDGRELRVTTTPGARSGAALTGPVRFTCGPGRMRLGDWEECGLAGYSGGVRYRTTVGAAAGPGRIDLGRVRGTAEVTVNGRPCGIRVCSPYTFDVRLDDGDNTIEILVLGTLAPYLDEVSPTHFVFPGQRVTGLFGPVHLRLP